jgi:hypothetical protein
MGKWGLLVLAAMTVAAGAQNQPAAPVGTTMTLPDGHTATVQAVPNDAAPERERTPDEILAAASEDYPRGLYALKSDRWSETDEREYGTFIAGLGESGCATVDKCLHDPRNPYRSTDPPGIVFAADCADLPYYLRFYFAFKRGLPFSFAAEVAPRGRTRDLRYTAAGNRVTLRLNPTGYNGYAVLDFLRGAVSSASYRIHPELETPEQQDFYSPALKPAAIRPGTVIYDPNGHLATVWKIERNGRIHYLDAHPDYSVTRGFYDVRFVRSSPGMGAGFKNWRPQKLVGGQRQADGTYGGGSIVLVANKEIADFSVEQYFGNGPRPAEDRAWQSGTFTLTKEIVDYYDYVRGQMAGGTLVFDPVREIGDMVDSNCADLHYRGDAVDLAIAAGLHRQSEPDRLPSNIYGTEGDWETYSTPSRDARLKTAFKELYDSARRFLGMNQRRDPKLAYKGRNLANDMLTTYDAHAARCRIGYVRSNGSKIVFGYEEARRRLFDMSFDPYQCPERRWGAKGEELATCSDGTNKAAWYEAEKYLRNQIDRTYDARMDFSREELGTPGPGKGVATPPETDVRTWLLAQPGATLKTRQPAKDGKQRRRWWWPF